jgi:hypothetical protein
MFLIFFLKQTGSHEFLAGALGYSKVAAFTIGGRNDATGESPQGRSLL